MDEIRGKYSYERARSILKDMHKESPIITIEISRGDSVKYAMELEDFIKNATVVE